MTGGPSLLRVNSGVAPSMADNGNSSLFAMDGDQTSLEDKVFCLSNFTTDGANCTGSKYFGKPVFLSSKLLSVRSICEHNSGELPGGVATKPSDDQVGTHLRMGREECLSVRISLQKNVHACKGGRKLAYIPSAPQIHSHPSLDTWCCYPICQHKSCWAPPNPTALPFS